MRVLGSGHVGGLPAAVGLERRRDERAQVHLHEGDGLQLPRVPVLRHHHLPGPADRGFLRSHISGDREAGQSRDDETRPTLAQLAPSPRERKKKKRNK